MFKFDKIYWHDGQIQGLKIIPAIARKQAQIILTLNLYKNGDAPERDHYEMVFEKVSRFSATADFMALSLNSRAGNIYSANLYDEGKSVYRFYLIEGYIEIECEKAKITKKSGI